MKSWAKDRPPISCTMAAGPEPLNSPSPGPHRVLSKHGPDAGELADVPKEREERDALEPIEVVHHADVRQDPPRLGGQAAAGVALKDVDEETPNGCGMGWACSSEGIAAR